MIEYEELRVEIDRYLFIWFKAYRNRINQLEKLLIY